MISTRNLPAIAVLLALALIPTVLHGYLGVTVSDGHSASAIPIRLNGLDGRPGERSLDWVPEALATDDFIERRYGSHLTLFVARSYDAKRLYHHPELAIAHGDAYERAEVVRLPVRQDVPLHVLSSPTRTSLYVLHYDGRFIDDPIRFQLRNALTLLVRPRHPMTLFFIRGRTAIEVDRLADSPAAFLLFAAIDGFSAQSGTGKP